MVVLLVRGWCVWICLLMCWGSVFWNRTLRTCFVSHASVVTYSVFRIRRGTWLARWSVTMLVFLISGVMHAVPLKLLGGACDAWPVMHWYFLAVLGIMAEDLVLGAFAMLGCLEGRRWRFLGYVWVWGWFAWSLPKIVFPNWMCWDVDS
jgi:hypothetical protein